MNTTLKNTNKIVFSFLNDVLVMLPCISGRRVQFCNYYWGMYKYLNKAMLTYRNPLLQKYARIGIKESKTNLNKYLAVASYFHRILPALNKTDVQA